MAKHPDEHSYPLNSPWQGRLMSVQEPSLRAMPAALAGRCAGANLLTRDEARGLPPGTTRMPGLPRAEQPARMRLFTGD
jgi:hypothetical protein